MNKLEIQLKIMHACEKGATGVYYDHRFVASLLYKDIITELEEMRQHETEHFDIFSSHIKKRNYTTVFFYQSFGVFRGLYTVHSLLC